VPRGASFGCPGRAHTPAACACARRRAGCTYVYMCTLPQYRFPGTYCSVQKGAAGSAAIAAPCLLSQAPPRGSLWKRPCMHARAAAAGRVQAPPRPVKLYPVAAHAWAPPAPGVLRAHSRARRTLSVLVLCCASALAAGRHFVAPRCACPVRPPVCRYARTALSGWRRMWSPALSSCCRVPRRAASAWLARRPWEAAPAARHWMRPAYGALMLVGVPTV